MKENKSLNEQKNIAMDSINFAHVEIPSFCSEKINGKSYINYGHNNLFPQELIEFTKKSITHASCLKLIQMAISGEGFTTNTPQAKEFLDRIDFETSNSTLLEKQGMSMSVFDGFPIEVIWSKTGSTIVELHHLPFENVRAGDKDKYGNVLNYYYNTDWFGTPNDFEIIPAFDPLKTKQSKKQLLYVSLPNVASDVYPLPTYTTALDYIASEFELSKHNLSATHNSFLPSSLITFFGEPTTEQRAENKLLFKRNFQGSENVGKFIINYARNAESKLQIDTIQNNNAIDYFINSAQDSKERICTSHSIISPALIAIMDNSSSIFSNGEELKTAWDVFNNTKIKNYQRLIEKMMNMLLKYAGFPNENYKIIPFNIVSPQENNNSDLTDNNLQ